MKNKPTRSKHRKKSYTPKGKIAAGMAYLILAILIVLGGGLLMIGNTFPNANSPTNGQPVITLSQQTEGAKNNLQLFTFPGATYTPTPSPTPTPRPTTPISYTTPIPPPATPISYTTPIPPPATITPTIPIGTAR